MREVQKNDLRIFLELFGEIAEVQCEFTDVPDLITTFEGSVLGVEHTRLYRHDPSLKSGRQLKPQESLQTQIVSRAHEAFRLMSPALLSLHVSFVEPFDYRKSDIAQEASALAQAVLHTLSLHRALLDRGEVAWVWSWEFNLMGKPFPKGVEYFSLKIEGSLGMEVWGPAYGYAVPSLPHKEVESIIRRKESHIGEYRTKCDRVWLLMVTDAGMQSSHYDITDELTRRTYPSRFDRLFLLTLFKRELTELQTGPMP